MDKILISRMMAIAERMPPALIVAIGAAPSVGRDRWMALCDLIEAADQEVGVMVAMINLNTRSDRSDDRFTALWDYLATLKSLHNAVGTTGQTTAQSVLVE